MDNMYTGQFNPSAPVQQNTPQAISADQFANMAYRFIQIPGFSAGDAPITIQIKSTGIMNMIANGRIPNTLMTKVTELFGTANKQQDKDKVPSNIQQISDADKQEALNKLNASSTGMSDMAELLKVFASASMVQPQYEDVKDYMTDAQLMAVFSAMYGEVEDAESFH